MSSPFARMNDQVLDLDKIIKGFKKEHPDEHVVFASTGFIVRRIFKGDRERLSFPFYGNHTLGGLVVTDKRIFFTNSKGTAYDIFMKILLAMILLIFIPLIPLLILFVVLVDFFLFVSIPFGLFFLLITFAVSIMVYQHRRRKVEYLFENVEKVRLNKMKAMFITYDKIDIYYGKITTHFAFYNAVNEPLKELIGDIGKK